MIKINQNDRDFILSRMAIPSYMQEKLTSDRGGFLDITEDDLETLCDLCGQHFQLFGIKENDEPNEYGLRLENLLDTLSKTEINSLSK